MSSESWAIRAVSSQGIEAWGKGPVSRGAAYGTMRCASYGDLEMLVGQRNIRRATELMSVQVTRRQSRSAPLTRQESRANIFSQAGF